jgi:dephospho-CoA kinase
MLKVGLTGGIACGKSRVLRGLAAAGLPTLDLDQVSHQVLAPGGAAYADVVRAFGQEIVGEGGVIDRKRLGALVFQDRAARERLNAIVHPRVREQEARESVAWAAAGQPMGITDAALLVETGAHLRFDRLVVVHCPPELQLQRLTARDSLDEAAARARIAAQMPIEDKRRYGHLTVDTSGPLADTDAQASALVATLRALATQRPARAREPRARILGGLVHGYQDGPGGLTPTALLGAVVRDGGLDLMRLARELQPAVTGAWFAPGSRAPGSGPASLGVSVAAWTAARRGGDLDLAASIMASLARLSGVSATESAEAVLGALLCLARLCDGEGEVGGATPELRALAERWGGAAPPDPITPAALATLAGMDAGATEAQAPEAARLLAALFQ